MKILLLLAMLASPLQGLAAVNVAAASDLKFALDELSGRFTRETGHQLKLSFGSSGIFATQIAQGAPFELFLSADESYVERLYEQGHTRGRGKIYALGRIAIVAPKTGDLPVDSRLRGLARHLQTGSLRRFAIANPQHAPYGQRALEALQHAGLWPQIAPYLVYGENVSQATQFAVGGSAEGGIVALSLVLSPAIRQQVRYAVIPQHWHSPFKQRMVLTKNATGVAEDFYHYLQTTAARAVFERYGFKLPDQSQ